MSALAVVLLISFLAGSVWFGMGVPEGLPPSPPTGSVEQVTLIVPGRERQVGVTLKLSDGHIVSVQKPSGQTSTGANTNYAGHYVIPGLVDMHAHWPAFSLRNEHDLYSFLHLYHGVTTVRIAAEMQPGASNQQRARIQQRDIAGPDIVSCGYFVDGAPPVWAAAKVITDPAEAPALVREIASEGYDCIKVYDKLSEEAVVAVREAAHQQGLPVIGHLPEKARIEVALIDDMQHMRGFHPPWPDQWPQYPLFMSKWEELDDSRSQHIIDTALRHNLAVTPTLVTIDRLVQSEHYRQMIKEPGYHMLPTYYREAFWNVDGGINAARFISAEQMAMVKRVLGRQKNMVKRLSDAGVRLHTGTDTPAPAVVPGAALHRELELFVEAGLSPEQALAAATTTPSDSLAGKPVQLLAPGSPADFIILREDPTKDLQALDSIVAVVKEGRLYSREQLDEKISAYQDNFGGFIQSKVVTAFVRMSVDRVLKEKMSSDTESDAP